jgi:hypothetical protein
LKGALFEYLAKLTSPIHHFIVATVWKNARLPQGKVRGGWHDISAQALRRVVGDGGAANLRGRRRGLGGG